jgi:hypothetical protein
VIYLTFEVRKGAYCHRGAGHQEREDAMTTKLVLTVAQGNQSTELSYRLEANGKGDLFDCLERLRSALFLTGSAVKSAKVIERDREWVASADLLQALNDPFADTKH